MVISLYCSLINARQLVAITRCSMAYSRLVRQQAFVNGKWVGASSGRKFDVLNPFDGSKLASVPDMDKTDVDEAISAARRAFEEWRFTTGKQRAEIMKLWYQILTREAEAIAELIVAENGKPMADGRGEVAYGSSFIEWFAEEARRIRGDVIDSPHPSKRYLVLKQPIGPVGVITPWNFPFAMITRKIGAALAAGCTVVVKPAEDTPLSALAIANAAHEAGLPPGVLNVVTCARGHIAEVGQALCESPDLASISFTGSTAVGRQLSRLSADTVKRMSLELGGHAPLIVFPSADVKQAVQGILASKFRCSGQTCVCSNRVFIHEDVYEEVVAQLSEEVGKMIVGNGFDPTVSQGPLINEAAVDKSERHVKDAVERGALVTVGGQRMQGNCFQPTVIRDVKPDMLCVNEETFGPVVPIIKFKDEAEVLRMANALPVGLAGYFFSQDLSQVWRVAEKLEVGMVGVNDGLISGVEIPFGGVKQSGLGREGGFYGIDEYIEIKYVCMGNLA